MSTPSEPVSISINDPVSGDIQAICGAITAACQLACSPQGQAAIEQALKDGEAFRKLVSDGWNGFLKLFH